MQEKAASSVVAVVRPATNRRARLAPANLHGASVPHGRRLPMAAPRASRRASAPGGGGTAGGVVAAVGVSLRQGESPP